jgi:hypothetical protein
MYGAYSGNKLIAYSPDAIRLDHFAEMGYTISQVTPEEMSQIANNEHRIKQVLLTAEMEVGNV